MPYNLMKPPRGLLELFRLKVGGKQPILFSEQVSPVVDVGPFYGSDLLLATSGTPTVGLLNIQEDLVFTATLRVHAVSGELIIGAGAATNVGVSWGLLDPVGNRITVGQQFFAQIGALTAVTFGCVVPPGHVLPSGWGVFARAEGTAAGADHSLDVVALVENYTQV